MIIDEINIKELIPQREPVVMVTKLLSATENSVTTALQLEEDNIFCQNGFFQECGLIENIAQTAAALNGYAALLQNQSVKLGYIGAVKNLVVHALPAVNSVIETTVSLENRVLNVDIIKGIIKQNDSVIAECEMKIFVEEN
jgi:3-hydroxymyristoyl/3-hydroxydecanoyl-(acyl carrier protein) dehydratase